MSAFQRIEFASAGAPEEVAELTQARQSPLEPGQVRVRMAFAPVNPADINYLQGTYGVKATLPATPGMEGSGVVVETSSDVSDFPEGAHVILFNHIGSWSQEVCVPADNLVRVPDELDLAQASMLRVNPPTAWRILTGYVDLKPGDWIAQNAANSGVGLALIQLAKALGLRTVNAVRSEAAIDICKKHGADLVFIDDGDFCANARAALVEAGSANGPRLGSNAVGGDSALRLMDLLDEEGTHVTYGAMSRKSLKVPNKFLIFKRLNLQGLWVTKWMDVLPIHERNALFADLAEHMVAGRLHLPVEKTYPLAEAKAAITHAQKDRRNGKILIDLS